MVKVTEAFELVKDDGYCLWVGNGVSMYLAAADGGPHVTPTWLELARQLERDADLTPLKDCQELPDRLERIHRARGFEWFQAKLREKLLHKLAVSIFGRTLDLCKTSRSAVPQQARRLACLGQLANPIVNFNLETLTSLAVSRAGGPCSIKYFAHAKPTELDANQISRSDWGEATYRRHIYHPHGALNGSGICVMTGTEYRSQRSTLAFQMAVHSAFMSHLVIVGMSLNDAYLRGQITKFRQQIRKIIWFQADTNPELLDWACCAGIDVVTVEWPDFWQQLDKCLPPPDQTEALAGWEAVMTEAWCTLHGGSIIEIKRFIEAVTNGYAPDSVRDSWKATAGERGESLEEGPKEQFNAEDLQIILRSIASERRSLMERFVE